MELVITPQEKSLIDSVNQLNKPDSNIKVVVESCNIGDGCIRSSGTIVYIFERKAKGDLLASIKDGRYKEQKSRLMATGLPPRQCIFLIEGLEYPSASSSKSRDRTAIWSSITNSFHRDGFTVFLSQNSIESATYLLSLTNSVSKFELGATDEAIEKPIITNKIKKSAITPKSWFTASLTLIPGVSEEIATVITTKYPSQLLIVNLIEDKGFPVLGDLRHGKSQRRIGDKLAEEIYNFLAENA